MKRDNKVLTVANYLNTHPKATGAQVAKKFKCSLAYAYVLMSKAKAINKSFEETVDEIERGFDKGSSDGEVNIMVDNVNHPPHYKTGGIEVIDYIEAKNLTYHLGNVVKYISRADHKGNKLEDLEKARWYLDRAINAIK
jgi:lipopolysaccharide biosynthesis regulator YciM